MKTEIKKIDWVFYLERINAIFYISIFDRAYGLLQRKVTGCGYTHNLCHHQNWLSRGYKSKRERQNVRNNYLKLINNHSPKLKQWHDEGLKWLKRKKELVDLTDKLKGMEHIDYDKLIDDCYQICLYGSTIPFLILEAIDDAVEEGKPKEDFKEAIDLFRPFRKESLNILHYTFLKELWAYAGKLIGVGERDTSFLTPDEVGKIFKGEKFPFKEKINKRKKDCISYEHNGKTTFLYNTPLENIGIISEIPDDKEIKGDIAFKGKVKGVVKIINAPPDMAKFKENDVLVSINSTPSLTPAIKKAAAVITDEGGRGCHAAIISRELKIPCLIGTKYATKIFKDGDYVEVDADKGVVRKL